jgi:hypothetical protein
MMWIFREHKDNFTNFFTFTSLWNISQPFYFLGVGGLKKGG